MRPERAANGRSRAAIGLLLTALVIVAAAASPARATHYRYGRLTWTVAGGNTIEFTLENSWRRSAYSTANGRCRNILLPALPSTACTGGDGFPGVGDVIMEAQGTPAPGTRFNFGDGSPLLGSPLGPLLYLVTAIDPANDWLIGTALDPASFPAADGNLTHTYAAGTFTAFVATCCRVSASGGHINNADGNYRLETRVTVGTGNRSPVSSMLPIVQCPINGLCTFTVPGSDPDSDPIRFRMSTAAEAGSPFVQPGPPDAPNAASINTTSGLFTWNTTGATLDPPTTLYSTQVMIEDLTAPGGTVKSKIPVDFFIQLVAQAGTPPVFNHPPTPACGSILPVNPFDTLTFTVQASDADLLQNVTLNASGLPSGASMTPTLPTAGNPVSSMFSWTPTTGQAGQYVVTFSATDDAQLQTLCSVTIDVSTCQNNSDCDDSSACTIDTCDPGNPNSNAGGCVYAPLVCDDTNVCTDDSCDPDDGCQFDFNTAPCDDGLFCTVGDVCNGAGSCILNPRDCSFLSDQCNLGVCNEGADQCEAQTINEGGGCDDGLFCTVSDTCTAGVCGGSERDCSDPILCTLDACDELNNMCTHTLQTGCCGNGQLDPGEDCDDGDLISGDGCEPDCTISPTCDYAPPVGDEIFVNDNGTDGTPPGCAAAAFTTIQAAVNAAQDGDIISVCPGTYSQSVQLNKALTLRSTDGPTATVLDTAGVTVSVQRSGTRVEGLTLKSDTTAVEANSICPPGGACGSPGQQGSNVSIVGNVIRDSNVGVTWNAKIDCASVNDNTFDNNQRHVALVQTMLTGTPAVLVSVSNNDVDGGGNTGPAVEVFGMHATLESDRISDATGDALRIGGASVLVAASIIERAGGSGVVSDDAPAGTQILENEIRDNVGDGVTIGANGAPTRVLNNNITGNGVGLGNEATAGVVDATLNWWKSQTGPSGIFTGVGDSIVNRAAGTTDFIEFLCKPFPQGFPSVEGVCSTEVPELRMLFVGSSPDIDPVGRFVAFESRANIDVDPRTTGNNTDGSQEVFLLNRKTKRSLGGVCLGGVTPGAPCEINIDCAGDLFADPLVLNGDCIMLTQVTDELNPLSVVTRPRVTSRGKAVAFYSNADLLGLNPDGSNDVFRWSRKLYEKGQPGALSAVTGSADDSQFPAPSLSARRLIAESAADLGQNADGNTELFVYDVKRATWSALTQTVAPADNRRPSVGSSGKQVVFDSTGDLNNDPASTFANSDGNREVFLARMTGQGLLIRQLTNTLAPVDNRAGGGVAKLGKLIVFSSNGNLTGNNLDGNREVFVWFKGSITQVTQSTDQGCLAQCAGDTACEINCGNVNPVVDRFGRFMSFESTEDLEGDGSANRRVFLYQREPGVLLRLSRSRFGENRVPRISNGRFVVWESTANLTGSNPTGDRVIYMFDRRKDE